LSRMLVGRARTVGKFCFLKLGRVLRLCVDVVVGSSCCVVGSVIVIVVALACTMGKLCFLKLGHLLSSCVVVGVVVIEVENLYDVV
jgi:hypothetical protein